MLVDDIIKVHKCGCAHVKRERSDHGDTWIEEAKTAKEAIDKVKQEMFEEDGGEGDYKLADKNEYASSRCREQNFHIVNCAQ
jgi:hypothetical protein